MSAWGVFAERSNIFKPPVSNFGLDSGNKKGDAPTTHPQKGFILSGCSGVHALLKLPDFGSGDVCDSKGHEFSSSAAGRVAANKQGEASSRKTPPDNFELKKTPNCYTHFSFHASLAILPWENNLSEQFFRPFAA
jgi:hypothetical protein